MKQSLRRLWAVFMKELRQLRRDPFSLGMIAGVPALQIVMFGYAINMDVRYLDAAVVDQANTYHSRLVVAELAQSQVMDFHYRPATPQAAQQLMQEGRISASLIIPVDFEQRLKDPQQGPVMQLVVDGSDQVVQSAARQIASLSVRELLQGQPQPQASIEIVNLYNPQRLAPLNTVPGLIGVILCMTLVMFTAMALVREREQGNHEFLITTPLSPVEITIGKILPFVGIGWIQVTLILLLGYGIFSVPVRGSLFDLYAASLLFILSSLALGIFISTLVQTQFQAMQAAFFSFLPQMLLSGFMFPFDGMPRAAQWLAEFLPMTHFVRLMRGIMLRGADLADLWAAMLALAAITAVLLTTATLRFHKRLD